MRGVDDEIQHDLIEVAGQTRHERKIVSELGLDVGDIFPFVSCDGDGVFNGLINVDLLFLAGAGMGELPHRAHDLRYVANAFERELNLGDAVLVGQVNVNDQTDNSNYDAYELSVSLENAHVILAEGEVLRLSTTDTDETYRKLVDTFAEGVVSRLK